MPKRLFLIGLFFGFAGLCVIGQFAPSRDLLALWLAADAVNAGNPTGIYPPLSELFAMRPPTEWYDRAAEIGHPGEVYPYIYPPIWAWLLAPVTQIIDFQMFESLMFALNVGMLVALPFLAARLVGFDTVPQIQRPARLWILPAIALLFLSQAGTIALRQGQLQILVAFLTLLALERAENDRPIQAGIAMGFAIAFKLSPLPLALIWLLSGRATAFVWSMLIGGALGLLSLTLAGWPLHKHFLALIKTIDQTALITTITYGFDTLIGSLSLLGQPETIQILPPSITDPAILAVIDEPTASWLVILKPDGYTLLTRALMLATIVLSVLALRSPLSQHSRAAVWATTLTAMAFWGPIGWAYYYLAPFSFAAMVGFRFGRPGWIALAVVGVCYLDIVKQSLWVAAGVSPMQTIGLATFAYLLLIAMCIRASADKSQLSDQQAKQ